MSDETAFQDLLDAVRRFNEEAIATAAMTGGCAQSGARFILEIPGYGHPATWSIEGYKFTVLAEALREANRRAFEARREEVVAAARGLLVAIHARRKSEAGGEAELMIDEMFAARDSEMEGAEPC